MPSLIVSGLARMALRGRTRMQLHHLHPPLRGQHLDPIHMGLATRQRISRQDMSACLMLHLPNGLLQIGRMPRWHWWRDRTRRRRGDSGGANHQYASRQHGEDAEFHGRRGTRTRLRSPMILPPIEFVLNMPAGSRQAARRSASNRTSSSAASTASHTASAACVRSDSTRRNALPPVWPWYSPSM